MIDYSKYKLSLKQYLRSKGFNPTNPMNCFAHDNKNTPSCIIHDDRFICKSCGAEGDVYDAVEILEGITDKKEQYNHVEKALGGYTPDPKEAKPEFKPDQEALARVIDYLKNHPYRESGVKEFLFTRGYDKKTIDLMTPYFVYWPGFDKAIKDLSKNTFKLAGIPLVNPSTNVSSWSSPGVVVRLSQGLKLNWYVWNEEKQKNVCKKAGSKACFTFPGPWPIEKGMDIILVEAEITAISMRSIGFKNVFPCGGTNGLKRESLEEIASKSNSILFAFDGDYPGKSVVGLCEIKEKEKGKKKVYPEELVKLGFKGKIKIAKLPDNKDPDDLIREGKNNELNELLLNAKVYGEKEKPVIKVNTTGKDTPFTFLGFDEKYHYVMQNKQNLVMKIARGDSTLKNMMKELAPYAWWFNKFGYIDEETNKASFDTNAAYEWFREESQRRCMYNDEKILGLGLHRDSGNYVFNVGDGLVIDGKKINFENYQGNKIYCRSSVHIDLKGKPWTIDQGQNFVNQLKTFKFERPIDYLAIIGYVCFAPFASILKRRPHIWITANKGMGKSTLLDKIIVPGVGEKQAMKSEGMSSEAFLRQEAGKDCRVPIIDEFEAHNEQQIRDQKKIMTLTTSAYSGALVGKGSTDHRPVKFNIKMMFCFASVNVRFDNSAARTRFVICRMKQKFDKKFCEDIDDFVGLRLRVLSKIHMINKYIQKAKNLIIERGYDNRTGDTYAPFLVGIWVVMSDNDFMVGDEYLQQYIHDALGNLQDNDHKNDDDRILERIMQERVRIDPSEEMSIAEMLIDEDRDKQTAETYLRHDKKLRRYGLRRCMSQGKEVLAIDTDHPEIRRILKETPFSDYREILQRHDYVIDKSRTIFMSGKYTRCIIFSWEKLWNEFFNESEPKYDDDIPFN